MEDEALVKVYIAGPMAGIPNENREAFAQRAKELVEQGHEPVDPSDVDPSHEGDCIGREVDHSIIHRYGCFLRAGITALMQSEAITFLPGWTHSIGATTEEHVARSIGLKVL